VNACFTSPNGDRIISASGDTTVRVWDAQSGQELRKLVGHTREVSAVCTSPKGATRRGIKRAPGDEDEASKLGGRKAFDPLRHSSEPFQSFETVRKQAALAKRFYEPFRSVW
jgi:WD40 repeat protein